MFRRMKVIELIVKVSMGIKPGQHVLIVTDDYARSLKISRQVAELCDLEGAETVVAVMEPRTHSGHEPPKTIAEAMQVADVIFHVGDTYVIDHTDAAKMAREKGIKFVETISHISEDYFEREISAADLAIIRATTERLAEIESRSEEARIISPYGTDIRMSLAGRIGIPIHPMGGPIIVVPDYAEAAIAPIEGSTEGLLVVDASVQGWNFLLREPLRLTVRSGRITEVLGPEDYVDRLKKLLALDGNANNCAAELGIGTSHTIPKDLKGWTWDYALAGTIHIAMGRNNDIGGETFSEIHNDLLVTQPTVWLDDSCIVEEGRLKV